MRIEIKKIQLVNMVFFLYVHVRAQLKQKESTENKQIDMQVN